MNKEKIETIKNILLGFLLPGATGLIAFYFGSDWPLILMMFTVRPRGTASPVIEVRS